MADNFNDMPNFKLQEIISSEEVLKLALENIAKKKGGYYQLIKEYILNYSKIDDISLKKIRNIILFIQEYVSQKGEKEAMKNLKKCLDKLGAKSHKNIFLRLFSLCIIYSENIIIDAIISNSN